MLDQAATPKVLGKQLRELLNIPGSLPPDLARLVELLEKQERAENVRRSDLGGRISGS
jgi:hypothetical protein